eukprot:gnl/MRDRNA2_/MRDRNA2_158984_c0_seq1.p1 gnl/MRDRNA2_/MRDRNA2_158984_c0~~gnl/MRDRNA2_/MRDRNA2_158984_c0_seq1.p1  ORF type:complete len:364 (-),score=88.91 gnl/MRDRNA2_/MRDRNA2_158984_c0_seq1:22-1113(-)
MSKRPAEEQLGPETLKANPFAGVSLFSGVSTSSGGLSAANPFSGPSLFGSTSNPSTLFTSAAAEAKTSASAGFALSADLGKSGTGVSGSNPFMGLSLFSPPPAAAEGLFSSAASKLPNETPKQEFHLQKEATPTTETTKAADSSPSPPVKLCLEQLIQETPPGKDASPAASAGNADSPVAADSFEQTGEEDEEVAFSADCKLWKLVKARAPAGAVVSEGSDVSGPEKKEADAEGDGDSQERSKMEGSHDSSQASRSGPNAWQWQDRGCGVIHLNRHRESGRGRLVMRMRGVRKVLLNTPVFPTTKYEKVGQKSVKFMGVDVESAPSECEKFAAYRLNLLSADKQSSFMQALQDMLQKPAAESA